jgi:hypothetical protein
VRKATERPILFTPAMVRAIIEGRKTQTRRIVDGPMYNYGLAGNRLYVREQTWKHRETGQYRHADKSSDASWRENGWKKVPAIHMPRSMCRVRLEVLGSASRCRVERLRDISDADVRAEGWTPQPDGDKFQWYRDLWESIHGAGSWAANPWVWVIEFKVLETK